MPNKTIYVKDEDLQVFEEAERLGGDSLSSIIAEALKRFVSVKRAEQQGMDEHTLAIDNPEQGKKTLKFVGRLLVSDTIYVGQTSDRRDRWDDWSLYQTQAGKVIVYWRHGSVWDGERGSAQYEVRDSLPGYDDSVFEFDDTVPGDILEAAAEALGQELVEFIE